MWATLCTYRDGVGFWQVAVDGSVTHVGSCVGHELVV
jgi:hypothetical protein